MELEKPLYDKFDLLTKLVGVLLVASGINKIRYAEFSAAAFLTALGALISVLPFYVKVKK